MKILFVTSHFGFLRNFEFAIRALAARGHAITLVADRRDSLGGTKTIDNIRADFPEAITVATAPKIRDAAWQPLGSAGTGLPPMAAAFFGVPLGILTIVFVSQLTREPTPEANDFVDAIRRPSPILDAGRS